MEKQYTQDTDTKNEILAQHKKNFDNQVEIKNKMKSAEAFKNSYVAKEIQKREQNYKKEFEIFKDKINRDLRS